MSESIHDRDVETKVMLLTYTRYIMPYSTALNNDGT